MGYKLYRENQNNRFLQKIQGEIHPLQRIDVPELETEEEVVDKIVELCMTTSMTIDEIRVMQEVEISAWGSMKKNSQK